MSEPIEPYTMNHVQQLEHKMLESQLNDLKDRVNRLETQIGRGILLLVANLAGVATTLAHALIQS